MRWHENSRWRRLPRRAAKRRSGGRIQPSLAILPPSREDECVICHRQFPAYVENGRGFCFRHSPDLASAALASPGAGQFKAVHRGVFIDKRYPSRRVCVRILQLAGRLTTPPKPPRPKKRPRDRRYVR